MCGFESFCSRSVKFLTCCEEKQYNNSLVTMTLAWKWTISFKLATHNSHWRKINTLVSVIKDSCVLDRWSNIYLRYLMCCAMDGEKVIPFAWPRSPFRIWLPMHCSIMEWDVLSDRFSTQALRIWLSPVKSAFSMPHIISKSVKVHSVLQNSIFCGSTFVGDLAGSGRDQ